MGMGSVESSKIRIMREEFRLPEGHYTTPYIVSRLTTALYCRTCGGPERLPVHDHKRVSADYAIHLLLSGAHKSLPNMVMVDSCVGTTTCSTR